MRAQHLLFKYQYHEFKIRAIHPSAQIPACRQTGVIQTSYDIAKAHGGVPIAIGIKVETKEGEGCEFRIELHMLT